DATVSKLERLSLLDVDLRRHICRRYGLNLPSPEWDFVGLILSDDRVLTQDQDGVDLTNEIFERLGEFDWQPEPDRNKFYSVDALCLVLHAFAKAGNLAGFVKKWSYQLSRCLPKAIAGEQDAPPLWLSSRLRERIAISVKGLKTTKQVLDCLEFLSSSHVHP